MYGHHRYFISLLVFVIILVGQQGYFRKEICQRDLFDSFFTSQLTELGNTLQ